VTLCAVFGDETSALVSRGSLNLTHRDSHRRPEPLVPGEVYEVELELDACAYRFAPGQRVRLSLAGSDWPNTAASPEPVTLTVHGGTLTLPRWQGPSPYPAPLFRPGSTSADETADGVTWKVERDVLARRTRCVIDHGSSYSVGAETTVTEHYSGDVSVDEQTFDQSVHARTDFSIAWPDVTVSTSATLDLTATKDTYDVHIELVARDQDEIIGTRSWHEAVPRDLA
jgi:uncharacterized protein